MNFFRPDRSPEDNETELQLLRGLMDVLAVVGAFAVAYLSYMWLISQGVIDRPVPSAQQYLEIAVAFSSLVVVVFWRQRLYRGRATVMNLWELETAVKGILLAAAILMAGLFLLKVRYFSRLVVLSSIVLSAVFVILERRFLASLARTLLMRGGIGSGTLIYGCDRTGQLLMKKIVQSPQLGRTVVGFLDDHVPVGSFVCCRMTQSDPVLFEAPVLGRMGDLESILTDHDVHEILVAEPSVAPEHLHEVLAVCRHHGLQVGVVPNLGDVRSDQLRIEDMAAIPVLRPAATSTRRLHQVAKRAGDVVLGAVVGILSAPIWILAACGIKLDDPTGPVLFAQERVGQDGERFRMFKFRTMRGDAPPYMSSPPGDVDPRITRVGRVLRKTGVDELPQLINVLGGEMSLVGPRPEMPHLVQKYGPVERQRLRVKPGMTGLWQISADRHAEIHENIEYDLYYVHHQSFLLDMFILLETAFFTIGLLAGSLDRRSSPARGSRSETTPVRVVSPDEPYVLVALDQRGEGEGLPEGWDACVPAAYAVSDKWPVRIVVAEGNRAALDELLAPTMEQLGTRGYETAYTPYRSRSDLRGQAVGARLVMTDLPHVAEWARTSGVDLLEVEDGGVRWWPQSRVPDPIVTELSEHLTVYVGPAEERSAAAPSG